MSEAPFLFPLHVLNPFHVSLQKARLLIMEDLPSRPCRLSPTRTSG